VPSVASEAKTHALKPSAPPAPRPPPASDRAPASPFESLLDDGAQAAAPPSPQPPPERGNTSKPKRSEPNQPAAPSKDSKPAKRADRAKPDRAKPADADKPGETEKVANTKTELAATTDKADKAGVSGQIVAAVNAANAKTDGDGKTKTDGKKTDGKTKTTTDANTDAQAIADALTPPNMDKPAVVAATVNTAPLPAAADPAPAPSKDDATAPAPTDTATPAPALTPAAATVAVVVTVAAAADTDPQAGPVAQQADVVAADAPKGKPAALVPAQADVGKPAGDTDDTKAPAKDAQPAQGDGKPQAAGDDSDKQAIAHARGETPANSHRAAKADAPQPAANANANATAAKPSADVLQTLAVNPPPHNAAATAANAAAAAAPVLQFAAQAPVPLAGVAVAIAGKALEGKHRFEIRLDPPELGRIEVRLDVDHDGQVTSHLIAHRADTLDLLRRDAAGLQRALQDAGLKTADNGLQFSLHDQSTGRQQDAAGSPAAAQLVVEDETLKVVEQTPAAMRGSPASAAASISEFRKRS
jgi:flagellar hook-length control protein FliK